jgi:drug/metabolite transporter (DMT)-like permease
MYFGNAGLAHYTFLAIGFWVVLVSGIAFTLVYAVGSTRGKRAARLWTGLCVAIAVLGGIGDVVWAMAVGEWRPFMANFGAETLLEMGMLALLFLGSMWFMAIRYTGGLKD